jgi:hypothetical protein
MATTDQPTPLVVCDAGPLIDLDELGCLDLLADFSEVLVPEAVWVEVLNTGPVPLRILPLLSGASDQRLQSRPRWKQWPRC